MDATGYVIRQHEHDTGWETPETAGARLLAARTRAGLTLADMAADLKISTNYLHAMETMDARSLPERAYALGFVRIYANRLGLPVDEIVEGFCETCLDARKPVTQLQHQSGPWLPEFQIPKGLGVLVAVLGMLALAGWYGYRNDPVPRAVPPVPNALQSWADSNRITPVPPMQGAELAQNDSAH